MVTLSRNDNKNVLELVRMVSPLVDEVVVVDSSEKMIFSDLKASLMDYSDQVRLVRAASFGYVEPLRPFAFGLPKNECIAYFDADERPNKSLCTSLSSIFFEHPTVAAFQVRRETYSPDGRRISNSAAPLVVGLRNRTLRARLLAALSISEVRDLQVRLFRKGRIFDSGTVHVPPTIEGPVELLPDEYSVHETHDRSNAAAKIHNYIEMELSTRRFSYAYASARTSSRALRFGTKLYARLLGRRMEDEMRGSDYVLFGAVERFIREQQPSALLLSDPYARIKSEALRLLSRKTNHLLRQLSDDIRSSGGVSPYLNLLSQATIAAITAEQDRTGVLGTHFTLHKLLEVMSTRRGLGFGKNNISQIIDEVHRATVAATEGISSRG